MSRFVDDSLYRPRIEGFSYDIHHTAKFIFPSCHFFSIVDSKMLYITRNIHDMFFVVSNFYPDRKFWYSYDGDPIKPRMSRMGFYTLYSDSDLYPCVRAFYHYSKHLQFLLVKNWIDREPLSALLEF